METARTTHDQEKINSFSKSFFGEMLSVTGMNSRMLETADVMVRTAFCGTRLWGDMSDWIKAFRQPMLWADDPDRLFEDFIGSGEVRTSTLVIHFTMVASFH